MAQLDKSVYTRRRIIVVLGVIAFAIAVVLIIVKPGSGSVPKGFEQVTVPGDLTEKPEVPTEEPAEFEACALGKLEVTAVTNQAAYGAGELPQLSLTIENTGTESCIADLGTAGMQFTIASGSDQVWNSADCQTVHESLPIILDPGKVEESDAIEWDRTRSSAETCDITRDPVVGGGASYHLTVSAAGAESRQTAQFLLY